MRILFYYFLPALVPIFLYTISYYIDCRKAKLEGKRSPKYLTPHFSKVFIISLVIAIFTFLVIFGLMQGRTIETH
jgi:hypothetical protein